MYYSSDFPNRTLCDVLNDMRKCNETRNYTILIGLVEEAQILGNRMEAGLGDKHDVKSRTERLAELKKEVKELAAQKKKLKADVEELGGTTCTNSVSDLLSEL